MEIVNLYTTQALAEKKGVNRHRVAVDKHAFIPVKVETAQTRVNKRGYGIKYLDIEEVKAYMRSNRKPKPKPKNNDYKFTNKAT